MTENAPLQTILLQLIPKFNFEQPLDEDDRDIVFYLVGPSVKPKIKTKLDDGPYLPLLVKPLD